MADFFIAFFAITFVILVIKKQFKLYKKNGITSLCNGNCTHCVKSCSIKKV